PPEADDAHRRHTPRFDHSNDACRARVDAAVAPPPTAPAAAAAAAALLRSGRRLEERRTDPCVARRRACHAVIGAAQSRSSHGGEQHGAWETVALHGRTLSVGDGRDAPSREAGSVPRACARPSVDLLSTCEPARPPARRRGGSFCPYTGPIRP